MDFAEGQGLWQIPTTHLCKESPTAAAFFVRWSTTTSRSSDSRCAVAADASAAAALQAHHCCYCDPGRPPCSLFSSNVSASTSASSSCPQFAMTMRLLGLPVGEPACAMRLTVSKPATTCGTGRFPSESRTFRHAHGSGWCNSLLQLHRSQSLRYVCAQSCHSYHCGTHEHDCRTLPKTVCLRSRCGCLLRVMKNWLPLVSCRSKSGRHHWHFQRHTSEDAADS